MLVLIAPQSTFISTVRVCMSTTCKIKKLVGTQLFVLPCEQIMAPSLTMPFSMLGKELTKAETITYWKKSV